MAVSFDDDDPLLAIYHRLIPLVTGNIEWWREGVRRWAKRKTRLSIPLPDQITSDEKIALLAAIYDHHATPVARISPWLGQLDIPAEAMSDDWTGDIPGTEKLMQSLAEGRIFYRELVKNVRLLREHWESHRSAVEMFIADVAKELKANQAGEVQSTATGFLGGAALADALAIHESRRSAFFRQLERQRISLGDECWHEARDTRPNSPRYLYLADSPRLRELAAAYQKPKTA